MAFFGVAVVPECGTGSEMTESNFHRFLCDGLPKH